MADTAMPHGVLWPDASVTRHLPAVHCADDGAGAEHVIAQPPELEDDAVVELDVEAPVPEEAELLDVAKPPVPDEAVDDDEAPPPPVPEPPGPQTHAP